MTIDPLLHTALPRMATTFGLDTALLQSLAQAGAGQLSDTDGEVADCIAGVQTVITTLGPRLTTAHTPFGLAPDRTAPPATGIMQTVDGALLLCLLAQVQHWLTTILVTYRDAGEILFPQASSPASQTNRVSALVDAGTLTSFSDPFKQNLNWGRRVRRAAVLHLVTTMPPPTRTPRKGGAPMYPPFPEEEP